MDSNKKNESTKVQPSAQFTCVVSMQCSILWRSMSMSIVLSEVDESVLFATTYKLYSKLCTVGAACSSVVT